MRGEDRPVARNVTKTKGKTVKKPVKPEQNQDASIDEFERKGMGVAPKE